MIPKVNLSTSLRLCTSLFLVVCTAATTSAVNPQTDATSRCPNIVLIFIDDMGYGDIGPFGSDHPTPHLDRMADEGMKLTDFYVSSAACTPSRSALLTGCYADRIGMGKSVVFPADKRGLNPDEITIAEILREAGYATGCFGKWHLGDQAQFMPLAQGFDEYQGIPYSNDMWVKGNRKHNYPPLPWMKQDQPVAHIPDNASQARITDAVTMATVDFIKRHHDRPFFAYVPHAAVHAPHCVTPDRLEAAGGDVMQALISEIDASTGRILDTLRDLGIDDNTLVLFTNDNGGAGKTSPGPLRGAKFGPKYEGHMRVATLARWPGRIPAGSVCSEMAATTDLLPTFARLAGKNAPSDRIIDGKDIGDMLLGTKGAKSPHENLVYEDGGIRQGRWKLVRYRVKADHFVELYDLESDLGEKNNIADKHPDKVEELTALLEEHRAELAENTRSAGFVDNPRPLLAEPGDLPTLHEHLGGSPQQVVTPAPKSKPRPTSTPPAARYLPHDSDRILADFEGDDYAGWTTTGKAFGTTPSRHGATRNKIEAPVGSGFVNSFQPNDRPTGTLTSPPFTIDRKFLSFLIGGGRHTGRTGISLLVGDQELRHASGPARKNDRGQEILRWHSWDLSDLAGKEARLRITDQHEAGWGHIVIDHIVLSDRKLAGDAPAGSAPPPRPGLSPDVEWSTFPTYQDVGYDQPLRPQFHFTSRKNWLNDPNGMLYADGEWHMYFQHVATANNTGPKSWGNAKSTDLVHWTQYPHAINPYPNVYGKEGIHTIWSGSAVVDVHNALGKQKGDVKTHFALYTATNPDGFFQGGGYSTDKGRTWTKINDGKPVIPHQEGFSKGQRDPRIFYYPPGKCYYTIMMIGGPDRKVRLWRSTDLLTWERAFDIPDKAAECIDMYEVAMDGDPTHKKWVISNAGTGYEVGEFDGKSWKGLGTKDHDNRPLRFDHGDAYYAAQVFNQAPNGRVVHVGWLRSKQAGYRPFLEAGMPFTQQMSIPAEITLRTTADGIRMFRNPVKEIESLYTRTTTLGPDSVGQLNPKLAALSPELIDLTLTFTPTGDLTLSVRGLPIHYDHAKREFHFTNTARVEGERAAWPKLKKKGPYRDTGLRTISAPALDGKVTLRALVDRASLELFVNHGQAAASFVVVPDPKNHRILITAPDSLVIENLVVNELKSAWGTPLSIRLPAPALKPTKKLASAPPSGPPSREIEITGKYLLFPVRTGKAPDGSRTPANSIRLFVDNVLVHQFWASLPRKGDEIAFWSYVDTSEFIGKTAKLQMVRGPHDGADDVLEQFESSDEIRSLKPFHTETGRQQFHFSQKVGWNNDVNGMVYHDGLWHLSWQCNPAGLGWGNMYWGHAVSKDLVHWEEWPRALRIGGSVAKDAPIHPAMALGQAFSGSAAVDEPNTLGLQEGNQKTIIAAYTSNPQGECLACSTDGGRTYQHLNKHHPVIVQPHPTDPSWKKSWGRDPKLIWHPPTKKWIIVTYRMGPDPKTTKQGRMAFYSSPDLKDWTEESRSDPVFHECPEFIELPVDGNPKNTKWLLFDATPKYQIGSFDGKQFTSEFEGTRQTIGGTLKAAQCFSNAPGDRAICMVWARIKPNDPQAPWNQGFTLPIELSLRTASDGIRCYANPVKELEALRLQQLASIRNQPLDGETRIPLKSAVSLLEINLTLRFMDGPKPDRVAIQLGEHTIIHDVSTRTFPDARLTSFDPDDGKLDLRIFADSATVEVFAENGAVYYLQPRKIQGEAVKELLVRIEGGAATIESLKVHQLKSIWMR